MGYILMAIFIGLWDLILVPDVLGFSSGMEYALCCFAPLIAYFAGVLVGRDV